MIDRNDPDIGKKLSGMPPGQTQQRSVITFASFQFSHLPNPWIGLHDGTVRNAISLAKWELEIPQYGCACKKDYAIYKAENPPDYSTPESLWLWGVALHNWVNRKLGKPEITIEEARIIWRRNDGQTENSGENLS